MNTIKGSVKELESIILTPDSSRRGQMRIGLIIGIVALTALLFFSAAQSFATTNGTDLLAQVDTLNSQIESDQAQFETEAAKLNARIVVLEEERDALIGTREDLAAKLADVDAIASQKTELESENAELTEVAAAAQTALAQLQTAYAEMEAKLVGLDTELEAGAAETQVLEAEIVSLKEALAAMSEQNSTNIADKDVEADAQIAALQATITEKTDALATADERIEALSLDLAATAQTARDLDETKAQLAAATADLEARTSEIAELQNAEAAPVVSAASVCQEKLDSLTAGTPIAFEQGSTELAADAMPILDQIAAMAVACAQIDLRLQIEGHTSNDGGDASNLLLSNGRANAVFFYLESKGVPSDAMRPVGFGASDPIADNMTAEGRQLNQRIAFNWNEI